MKIKFAKLMSAVAASRRGATAIEYGLIAALIALVVAGGSKLVGNAVNDQFGIMKTCVEGGACSSGTGSTGGTGA